MHVARMFLLVFALVLIHGAVQAREVVVVWQMQADETLEQGKQRAMEQAWAEAVFQESLELLPGELAPQRRDVLAKFLAPLAERFILESEEVSLSETVDGMHLGLEVSVDTGPLRQLLQRVGVFYTAGAMLPYSLYSETAEDAPADAGEQIARLQLLTGVQPQPEALPSLRLSREGAAWKGVIETGRGSYDVAGSDLQTVWLALWGWYFSIPGLAETESQEGLLDADLMVEGWQSPDGLYAFDEVLKGFRPSLARATLKTLSMRSGGVMGVWELALRDEAAFRQRLEAYLEGRGLAWDLVAAPAGSDVPVTPDQDAPPSAMPSATPSTPPSMPPSLQEEPPAAGADEIRTQGLILEEGDPVPELEGREDESVMPEQSPGGQEPSVSGPEEG